MENYTQKCFWCDEPVPELYHQTHGGLCRECHNEYTLLKALSKKWYPELEYDRNKG